MLATIKTLMETSKKASYYIIWGLIIPKESFLKDEYKIKSIANSTMLRHVDLKTCHSFSLLFGTSFPLNTSFAGFLCLFPVCSCYPWTATIPSSSVLLIIIVTVVIIVVIIIIVILFCHFPGSTLLWTFLSQAQAQWLLSFFTPTPSISPYTLAPFYPVLFHIPSFLISF